MIVIPFEEKYLSPIYGIAGSNPFNAPMVMAMFWESFSAP
jgi:hypothetical protein